MLYSHGRTISRTVWILHQWKTPIISRFFHAFKFYLIVLLAPDFLVLSSRTLCSAHTLYRQSLATTASKKTELERPTSRNFDSHRVRLTNCLIKLPSCIEHIGRTRFIQLLGLLFILQWIDGSTWIGRSMNDDRFHMHFIILITYFELKFNNKFAFSFAFLFAFFLFLFDVWNVPRLRINRW